MVRQNAPLFVDSSLVNEHDGDLVADRIEAVAGDTPKAARVGVQFHFGPAGGADEDFEQVWADGHVEAPVYQEAGVGGDVRKSSQTNTPDATQH